MKKTIGIVLLGAFAAFSLIGCSGGEADYSHASGFESEVVEELSQVNLDGVGDNDDKVIASVYRAEDKKSSSFNMIEVYLGDGRYASRIIVGYVTPSLSVADFFDTGKQELIVTTAASTSSYGSADIFVLDVANGEDTDLVLVDRLTILDGSKDGRVEAVAKYKATLFTITDTIGTMSNRMYEDLSDFCSGSSIIKDKKTGQDQLVVYHLRNEAEKLAYSVLAWNGSEWEIRNQGFDL